MATIDNGDKLALPRAKPGERVDIISFVVTKAGWETLRDRIRISSSNNVRILTRLIYKSASELIDQAGGNWDWRHLPNNHAKAILYRKQKVAVLGSFNLTKPSLDNNIECLCRVDDTNHYNQMAEVFEGYWTRAEKSKDAIVTRETIAQAIADTLDDREEGAIDQEVPRRQAELTDGPREPWPFQEDIIQQVTAWLDTVRDTDLGRIVKLPTGAGKTLVAAEAMRRLLEQRPRARIFWVCHRVELLRQSWLSVCRQLNGSIPETSWFVPQHIKDESNVRDRKEFLRSKSCQVVFCTQGMLPHLLKHNRQERFDLTVVDECHRFHPRSKTYRALYNYCSRESVPRLGLTATPLDHDKRGFDRYWDSEAMFGKGVTRDDLEQKRFLSQLHRKLTTRWETNYIFDFRRQYAGPEHLESELVTRIGEFNNDKVNREVARAWQEYRSKRQRVLCFAVTIEHAETLKEKYFVTDGCVRMAHSGLTMKENRQNLEWFKEEASESRMLVSVLMLAEGIDLPKTDCLFMVRPTFSPELYQQMIGRGFRGPEAHGTEDCAVVDFTSQYVDRNKQFLPFTQVWTNIDEMEGVGQNVPEEDDEPDDLDASGKIWTVRDLKEAVADLQDENGVTLRDACEELAHELDYTARTLVNYYYTKPDDYPLGWEDPETNPAEQSDDSNTAAGRASDMNGQSGGTYKASAYGLAGVKAYVTRNKLLDLRAHDLRRFEEIASLTNVASSTLRSYCSDQENFRRWRTNNRDKVDQVLLILAESLTRSSDGT